MSAVKTYSDLKSKHKIHLASGEAYVIDDLVYNRVSSRIKYLICHEVGLSTSKLIRLRPAVLRQVHNQDKAIRVHRNLEEVEKKKLSFSKLPYHEKFKDLFKKHFGPLGWLWSFTEKLGFGPHLLDDEMAIVSEIARQRFKNDPENWSLAELIQYRLITSDDTQLILKDFAIDCRKLKVIGFYVHPRGSQQSLFFPIKQAGPISYPDKTITLYGGREQTKTFKSVQDSIEGDRTGTF